MSIESALAVGLSVVIVVSVAAFVRSRLPKGKLVEVIADGQGQFALRAAPPPPDGGLDEPAPSRS